MHELNQRQHSLGKRQKEYTWTKISNTMYDEEKPSTFPFWGSTSSPSRLSPTTVISLRSGLIDVCCIRNQGRSKLHFLGSTNDVEKIVEVHTNCECNCHAQIKKISLRQSNSRRKNLTWKLVNFNPSLALIDYALLPLLIKTCHLESEFLWYFSKFQTTLISISHLSSYKGKIISI